MNKHEIPTGWSEGTISSIAEVNPAVSINHLSKDALVSFIAMADVSEGGRLLRTHNKPLHEVSSGFTRFEEGDTLFAKITPCMENGKGAFAINLTNGHGFGSTEFHVLRANEHGDPAFLYHQSLSSSLRTKALAFFTGSAGQQRVDAKFFERYPLLVPPVAQQSKIARILTTLDELIEKMEALIAKYHVIKQGLMHDLFTRGVDENGHLRPSYQDASELYKESELGWIPKEWNESTVGDHLLRIEQGWSPDCGNDPAPVGQWGVLKTTSIVWSGYQDFENKALPVTLSPRPEYEVKMGDLLMTRGGPNSRVGVVAFVYDTQPKLMMSDKLYRLVPDKTVDAEYLGLALSSNATQIHLSTLKTGLAESQTNISQQIVRRLRLAIPDPEEQRRIADRIRQVGIKSAGELKYLSKLKLQKAGLMQDLLTGEVTVKVDDEEATNG